MTIIKEKKVICVGSVVTGHLRARVFVDGVDSDSVLVNIKNQNFSSRDLREAASLFNDMADILGGETSVVEKTPKEYWLNVYPTFTSEPYTSKKEADLGAGPERVKCLHLVEKL